MIKKILSYLKWQLSGIKLRNKILLSYMLFIITPLGVFSYFTYEKFSNIIENYTIYSTQKNFDQTFSYLTVTLNKVIRISDIAIINADIQNFFLAVGSNQNEMDKGIYIHKVMQFLETLQDEEDIFNIELYIPDSSTYAGLGYFFPTMKEARGKKWYNNLNVSRSKIFWCPTSYFDASDFNPNEITHQDVLSAIRTVKNPGNLQKNIGLLRVDFNESTVKNILKRAVAVKNSLTYIQNSQGIPVTVSDQQLYEKLNLPISQAMIVNSVNSAFPVTDINGQKSFYLIRQLDQTDWYLTTVIPYNEIFLEIRNIRNQIFILILLIATTAFAFAWYMSYSLTKRIYILTHKMKDVQNGRFDSAIETNDRDEIGELTKNYNYMLERIKDLVEERYKAGLYVKNAELKALQAQINPHFLYNTLDMINWHVQKNRVSEAEQAINSLAMFYKLSLSKGKDEIPIRDELEHITYYVQLQNMRFQNKIYLVIEIDEEIQEYLILKLTLQPIVENAIQHGILRKPSREGTIIIEGRIENGDVMLFVQDDGIGMTGEHTRKLMSSKLESKHNGGYGVKNIIERFKIYYGEQYGLIYKSICGQGTIVEIRMPAREDDHNN